MTKKKKVWSLYPKEAYSVIFEGKQYGIGLNPIFDTVPGSWNLLTILWAEKLEALLPWTGKPGDFPYGCGLISYAVGSALQDYSETHTLGELAAENSPVRFVELLKTHPKKENFIMVQAFSSVFWQKAEEFAGGHRELASNVIRADFSRPNVQ